jgi:hypothetical protein
LTRKVLDWINERRTWLGLDTLDKLQFMVAFDVDPISASLHPDCHWTIGRLQVPTDGGYGFYDVPEYVHQWLAEWRRGEHELTP